MPAHDRFRSTNPRDKAEVLSQALPYFHRLIYRRIMRRVLDDDAARRMPRRNSRTSPYLWAFTLLTVVPALLFWRHGWVLMAFCVVFVISYVVAYMAIVRFKVPSCFQP